MPQRQHPSFSSQWSIARAALCSAVLIASPLQAVQDKGLDAEISTTATDFTPIAIHPGHTGAWFNPQRDGEGIQVEILDDQRALVFWFSYPPEAEGQSSGGNSAQIPPQQLWIGGDGVIVDNTIVIDSVVRTRGPSFGPNFDPATVERQPWGRFQLRFRDCQQARLDYQGPAGFGEGQLELQRLTGNPRIPCGADSSAFQPPSAAIPGASGNWFDPSHDGEGWFIQEIAPGLAGVSWLSYTSTGEQAWMLGLGQWNGRSLRIPQLRITSGTFFDALEPAEVERMDWGAAHFIFDDCNRATLSYAADLPGFPGNQLTPQRLTRSAALDCGFTAQANLAQASWLRQQGAPALSELPAAVLGDAIYIAGGYRGGFRSQREVWRYFPNTGLWEQRADLPGARDHGMMAAHGGHLYFFGGAQSGTETSSAWRYDPDLDRWDNIAGLPEARSAGAAVSLDDSIYLLGGDVDFIDVYQPASNQWQRIPLNESSGRDHSNAVAFRDELWLIGGRRGNSAHSNVLIFNPLTGQVRAGPRLIRPRSGFAALTIGDQILVAGGENFSPFETIPTAEYFDPAVGQWQNTASLPLPVHGVSGVSFDGRIYLMPGSIATGGVNNPGVIQILTPGQ